MQIVIDIPKGLYMATVNGLDADEIWDLRVAVSNGTPLSKGHGDLIDRDKIECLKAIHNAKFGRTSWSYAIKKIKYSAPTVIEADKTECGG